MALLYRVFRWDGGSQPEKPIGDYTLYTDAQNAAATESLKKGAMVYVEQVPALLYVNGKLQPGS